MPDPTAMGIEVHQQWIMADGGSAAHVFGRQGCRIREAWQGRLIHLVNFS